MRFDARPAGEWGDGLASGYAEVLDDLEAREASARMWAGDHTLWADDPTELADRLGWLHVLDEMLAAVDDLEAFAAAAAADGFTDAVVLGMGGSSLFPEVVATSIEPRADRLRLHTLDTTHPDAVAGLARRVPLATTLFVVASKSGTTIETRSHEAHFWELIGDGDQFVAITDPGSELAGLARDRGYRRVFENRADIGGRFSALSYFGLVPAALHGADIAGMLDGARSMAERSRSGGTALALGAAMAAGVRAGRDKLTIVTEPALGSFGLWLEQLVAESTGKHGVGVVPVVGEPTGPSPAHGGDRLFVSLTDAPVADAGQPVLELGSAGPDDLGSLVFLWEAATALCGAALGINPFDQPDVASAKAATARVLDDGSAPVAVTSLAELLATVRPGDYVAIMAYVDPTDPCVAEIEAARFAIGRRLGVATTFGLGPRFLHSTGQLHKGGAPTGVFVQLVSDPAVEIEIPGRPYGFATLIGAQADGDLETLRSRGLRAGRVELADLLGHEAGRELGS